MPVIEAAQQFPRPPLEEGELGYLGYEAGVILGPWPIDLGDLRLDRIDEYGGAWNVTAFTGRGSSSPEIAVSQRPTGHGAWVGDRWWAAKTYTIDGAFEGEGPADRFYAEQRLLGAVPLEGADMILWEETARQTWVIPGGEVVIDAANTYAFTFQIPLLAPDPFRYGLEPFEAWTGLPMQTGGLTWPATWPATWDGVVSSGTLTVENEGNFTSYPTFRVYGPLPDLLLSLPSTGEQLGVDLAADGESLAEGEWLEIDMRRQSVKLMGTASRRRSVRGTFFGLPPGLHGVLFTSTAEFNDTAHAELVGFSTWV